MPKMPDIWSDRKTFYVTPSELVGALAKWAIRQWLQEPHVPPALQECLGVASAAASLFVQGSDSFVNGGEIKMCLISCHEAQLWYSELLNSNPEFKAWNSHGMEEFIDFDALARNAAHDIAVESQYSAANDI